MASNGIGGVQHCFRRPRANARIETGGPVKHGVPVGEAMHATPETCGSLFGSACRMEAQSCRLCTGSSGYFHRDRRRDYYRCSTCSLVFVPAWQHLDAAAEKAVYDRHENRPDDPGYRRFLARLFDPLIARLPPGACGLDFGSGPEPTLPLMFQEVGFPMTIYDPFYAPDPAALNRRYDFITSTEVFEHLAEPGRELRGLLALLEPGGWLGVMTKRVRDHGAFTRWHYIQDPTHVSFFSEATFAFIAARYRLELSFPGVDTALLRKPQ